MPGTPVWARTRLRCRIRIRSWSARDQAHLVHAHLGLEDAGQPAPQPRRRDAARAARGRMDRAPGGALVLDRDRARGDGVAAAAAGRTDDRRAAQSAVLPRVLA